FSNSLRGFAATLHFHSPAAYLFVRKEFLKCLPHQNTLRKWMQNINSNSGISTQTLKIISDVILNAQEKENKIVFNLTIDEMSIKKNNSKVIKSHFMKKNVDVVNITFDGASLNIYMCEKLGARLKPIDIEDIVPYFAHSNNEHKRISIIYDACHMIKLVRNAIAKYNLNDKDGRTISWKYIKQLVFLQDAEKLYPAVKIGHRHINFNNEKMKVSLAVQVLSTSVCDTLQFLEHDLILPQFAAASGTATFCKMLNDIFDLLILNSFSAVAEKLFNESTIEFLLTYKLSQDHIETWFALIRRMNGYNNNPSTKQFQSSF
ncbi:THAP domain-containing protein 9, partial [Trachymyrmex cornetzi]